MNTLLLSRIFLLFLFLVGFVYGEEEEINVLRIKIDSLEKVNEEQTIKFESKLKEIDSLTKENKIIKKESSRKTIFSNTFIGGFFITILLLLLLYGKYIKLKKELNRK